ncbi:MAG: NAD-dependent epimerase/dehydratase family protein [Gemmatimonadetes bacterium]|nr:NAD-dependent epimerase/dehydratase family protein [Gemmatimonadota bacterium]
MKLLVTGGSGLLGTYLMRADWGARTALGTCLSKAGPGLERVDLTSRAETEQFLSRHLPETIIHTVALADVDGCHERPYQGYQLTVDTTAHIVDWIRERSPDTRLVYISTDHVYDGPGPHREGGPKPSNVYALLKLWAEDVARRVSRHSILRINLFGERIPGRASLSDWVLEGLRDGRPMQLFGDVYFSPLHISHLVEVIRDVVRLDLSGTYNAGASGAGLSKAEFAVLIAKAFGYSTANTRVIPVAEGHFKAYRPADLRMNVELLESRLNRRLPTVHDGIALLHDSHRTGEVLRT